jgi:hypothetical protein
MSVVITEECNILVNSEEVIGIMDYLTLQTRCRIDRCRYNRVPLHIIRYYYYYYYLRIILSDNYCLSCTTVPPTRMLAVD